MGESLFDKFIDEEVENMQTAILYHGVAGILLQYEQWLVRNGYLKMRNGEFVKQMN